MLGLAMVGASSGPPDSMTSTCAPDADSSAARTEPAAPAPTTMKSYRLSSFDSLIISSSQDFDSLLLGALSASVVRPDRMVLHRTEKSAGHRRAWRHFR